MLAKLAVHKLICIDREKKSEAFCFTNRVRYFLGRALNLNQSEARKHCLLTSDWLKLDTLPLLKTNYLLIHKID